MKQLIFREIRTSHVTSYPGQIKYVAVYEYKEFEIEYSIHAYLADGLDIKYSVYINAAVRCVADSLEEATNFCQDDFNIYANEIINNLQGN